jgi:ankyrin repeat protein
MLANASQEKISEKDHQGLTPVDHAFLRQDKKIISAVLGAKIGKEITNLDVEKLSEEHDELKNYLTMAVKQAYTFSGKATEMIFPEIHLAVLFGNKEKLNTLLDSGQNPNSVDPVGITPLHYAVLLGKDDLVRRLIQAGADPTIQTFKNGRGATLRPLDLMALIAKNGADAIDPLKLTLSQKLIFGSLLLSSLVTNGWILPILQSAPSLAAYFSGDPSIFLPRAFMGAFVHAFPAYQSYIPSHLFEALTVFYVGKQALKGLKACWKNRHMEVWRPIRNAVVHLTNSLAPAAPLYNRVKSFFPEWICFGSSEKECIANPEIDPQNPLHAQYIMNFGNQETCKGNYRKLALRYHPDKDHSELFRKIQESAETVGCLKHNSGRSAESSE